LRRFLLAAGLAVVLHGLLFIIWPDWTGKSPVKRPRSDPLSVTLGYRHLEKIHESPSELPDLPEKKTIPTSKRSEPPKKKQPDVKKAEPIYEPKEIQQETFTKSAVPLEPEKVSEIFDEDVDLSSVRAEESPHIDAQNSIQNKAPESSLPPLKKAAPIYLKNPAPKYPRTAKRRGYEGTVLLEVLVDQKGMVKDLRLFQSSGYNILDRAAINSVKKWVFEPGRRGDEAVEMWVKVPVRFRLD